ncbi:hypothetical protein SAMN05518672_103684 [Chitinophaga sp. CF118]|uniref:AAA family ATPase n=1 Tax=Chitinophaga sp. CF118 TaxID=1884367 RepID=UPI0008EB57DC|nr:AAA family ATPase [Chitinophaga sp. CF118]SFD88400.1 hypothetical protein SAMN05518672_103684 [Chitinophaga sp. CF118]
MVIIVLGLPGAGKSYFASRLATRINAKYISSDQIRKNILDSRTYSHKEKLLVYDEMLIQMRQSLSRNNNLVLDATFHRKDFREKFMDEAMNAGGIIIEIIAGEAVIEERLKRKRTDSDADFEVYKIIKEQWEPLNIKHLILLSTDDNIEAMLHSAVDYLKLRDDQRTN